MEKYNTSEIPKSSRITRLVDHLYAKMPEIESYRAKLITESYKETEDQPIITRRAKAFSHILHNIPIIIRDEELIVGSNSIAPRGCQTFPEFSFQWLEDELDTVATRTADPFYISEQAKADLREVHKYWKGKTTSELATAYMAPEAIRAIDHNIFTPGNYFYNGVGHVTVKYWEVLEIGYEGIMAKAQAELDKCNVGDGDYAERSRFLEAVIMSCQAVIDYADRYAKLALEMAEKCTDPQRKAELLVIASNCSKVPAKGATNFWEACQSFWFVQQLLHIRSFQNLTHRNNLFIDHQSRHTHHAVLHDLCHVGHIFHLNRKPHVLNRFLGSFQQSMAALAAGAENLDAANSVFCFRAAVVFNFFCLTCRATAVASASGSLLFFFLLLSK